MAKTNADLLGETLIKQHEDRKSERANFDGLWQKLVNYVMPQAGSVSGDKSEAESADLYDTTARDANQTMAAGQRNWQTPSNEMWFAYEPPQDTDSRNLDAARSWYAKVTEIAFRKLAQSNFYTEVHELYLNRGGLGTGIPFVEQGKRTTLNFRQFFPWECTLAEDDEKRVDTVYREFEMTARQAAMMFGKESLSEEMQKALGKETKAPSRDTKFKFLHCVYERGPEDRIVGKLDPGNKPIAGVYLDYKAKKILRVSGYDEMPYCVTRFLRWGKTPWGYSPAVLALPNARQCNYLVEFGDALVEQAANPPMQAPDDMDSDLDLRAGGMNFYRDPNRLIRELFSPRRVDNVMESLAMKQRAIKAAFYVDLFNMFDGQVSSSGEKATAEEIAERRNSRLEQYSPANDRLNWEFLNPTLRRVFGLCYRAGDFGTPPEEVMRTDDGNTFYLPLPSIQYTSRIALALKAIRNQGFMRTVQGIGPLIEMEPSIKDNFDLDKASRRYALNCGFSPDDLRSEKDVKEIRDMRTKQQQAQTAIEMVQGAAQAGKDAGKMPPQMQKALGVA